MNNICGTDHPFFQTCNSRNRFECRTWCCTLLCGSTVQRACQVTVQFCIVSRIHGISQSVVIISRIRHICQYIPCIRIGDHTSGTTRFQCKLSRCDLQILDLIHHKAVCRISTASEFSNRLLIILQNTLVIQEQTNFSSRHHIIQNDIFIQHCMKIAVGCQF